LFRFANPTYLISGRQSVSTLFCFELTNGRRSGWTVRTQQFRVRGTSADWCRLWSLL